MAGQSIITQNIFKRATAVCFDVDSTLIREEGIDRLADACGVGEQVERLTRKAMSGGMGYRDSLTARLNIIRPTLEQVNELKEEQLSDINNVLTPGIRELVELLKQKNKSIYIISGGFRQLIEPLVESIGISNKNIYCNELEFNNNGEYMGFDEDQYTCRSNGKKLVMNDIKKIHESVVMIGDGMTDYESCPPAVSLMIH
jgi:phosphoserine phosphatase